MNVSALISISRQVWILSGQTGELLEGWPIRVARSLQAPPLMLQLDGQSQPLVVSVR